MTETLRLDRDTWNKTQVLLLTSLNCKFPLLLKWARIICTIGTCWKLKEMNVKRLWVHEGGKYNGRYVTAVFSPRKKFMKLA